MTLVPRVIDLLKNNGQDDVTVFVGGIIPADDIDKLKALGVRAVFGPGTATTEVIKALEDAAH